jgi:two-component system chemotaxis response regulator CheY
VDFWANFNLNERVQTYEARYVRRALIDGEGSITRAARLLGLHHHATLAAMLDEGGRHKDLAYLRTPPGTRRQSIINPSNHRGRPRTKARAVNILCVENYQAVADAVKETLAELGWTVELCADGIEAMRKIESKVRYQLLILNDQLPGHDGLELARRARQLPHRRRTPIIMLSASDVEQDALGAGVDSFLRRPRDIGRLSATVMRLLTKNLAAK